RPKVTAIVNMWSIQTPHRAHYELYSTTHSYSLLIPFASCFYFAFPDLSAAPAGKTSPASPMSGSNVAGSHRVPPRESCSRGTPRQSPRPAASPPAVPSVSCTPPGQHAGSTRKNPRGEPPEKSFAPSAPPPPSPSSSCGAPQLHCWQNPLRALRRSSPATPSRPPDSAAQAVARRAAAAASTFPPACFPIPPPARPVPRLRQTHPHPPIRSAPCPAPIPFSRGSIADSAAASPPAARQDSGARTPATAI